MSTEELDAVTKSSSNDQDDTPEEHQEMVKKAMERVEFHELPEKLGGNFKKPTSRKDASAPHSSAPMQPPQQTDTETTMTSYQLSCEEKAAGIHGMEWTIDPYHPWNVGNIYQKCLSTIYGEGHPKGRIDMQDCYNDKGKVELNPLSDATMGIDRLHTPTYYGFSTPPANVVLMPLWTVEESAVWMRRMVGMQEGAYILRYDERHAASNPLKRRKVLLLNNTRDVCLDAIATWEKAAKLVEEKTDTTNNPMDHYRPMASTIQPLSSFHSASQNGQKRTIDEHAEKFNKGLEEAREHEAAAAATAAREAAKQAAKDAEKEAGNAFYDNLEEREAAAEAEEAKKEKKGKMRPQKGGDYAFTQPVDPELKNIADRNDIDTEMQYSRYLYAQNH